MHHTGTFCDTAYNNFFFPYKEPLCCNFYVFISCKYRMCRTLHTFLGKKLAKLRSSFFYQLNRKPLTYYPR